MPVAFLCLQKGKIKSQIKKLLLIIHKKTIFFLPIKSPSKKKTRKIKSPFEYRFTDIRRLIVNLLHQNSNS